MSVRRFCLLDCGSMDCDNSMLVFRYNIGKRITIPVVAAVLDTEDGYILFDTGMHPDGLARPELLGTYPCHYTEENFVVNQLKKLNIAPEEIKYVINSHLHFDHTGSNKCFPDAAFFVQRAEYRWAKSPAPFISGAYNKEYFDVGCDYHLLDGSQILFPGVTVFLTPGHTPGHQILLLQLDSGKNYILTGDACYTEDNLRLNLPDGNGYDRKLNVDSLALLKTVAALMQARIMVTHDVNFWSNAKPAPYWYE